jgi:uncharacterized short protein YbdD (DUF466 family)
MGKPAASHLNDYLTYALHMDTNQPNPAEDLPMLTEEEFAQFSQEAGGSDMFEACNYAHAFRIAQRAYAKGADVELEACCAWLDGTVVVSPSTQAKRLRATRRPKPPSLRAQALAILDDCNLDAAHENTLRRALEALPE